jgi:ADP-ribosyl-[dinitrogen reductase] hydrolase
MLWAMVAKPNRVSFFLIPSAAFAPDHMGAVYGLDAIPTQWREKILSCRPEAGLPGVHQPRPACFWPVDALDLAEQLVVPRKQQ